MRAFEFSAITLKFSVVFHHEYSSRTILYNPQRTTLGSWEETPASSKFPESDNMMRHIRNFRHCFGKNRRLLRVKLCSRRQKIEISAPRLYVSAIDKGHLWCLRKNPLLGLHFLRLQGWQVSLFGRKRTEGNYHLSLILWRKEYSKFILNESGFE